MLFEFSVENFRSFRDRATLDMRAGTNNEFLDTHTTEAGKERLVNSAVIYGANASGKSNLITAILFMRRMVLELSKRRQSQERLPIEPFRLDMDSRKKPATFEIVFSADGSVYRYGFQLDSLHVYAEWLFTVAKVREVPLFLRERQSIDIKPRFKEGRGLETKTRPNALFLSVVDQFAGEISGKIIKWFNNLNVISGLDDVGYRDYSIKRLADLKGKESVLQFLKIADINVEDIKASVVELDLEDTDNLPVELKNAIGSINKFLDSLGGDQDSKLERLDLQFLHKKYDKKNNVVGTQPLGLAHQSHGTQKIFSLSGPILDTIENGKSLIIDELDARLHPLITRYLIDLFHDPSVNRHGAQLIFATHDTQLLERKQFRRDQIWFTEKDDYGATQLYSLTEFKPRKDTSIGKEYIKGKYGAIPFLGDFSEILRGN